MIRTQFSKMYLECIKYLFSLIQVQVYQWMGYNVRPCEKPHYLCHLKGVHLAH